MIQLALAIALAATNLTPDAGAGHSIHVRITGLRNERGHVRCFLYRSERGYPKDQEAAFAKSVGNIADHSSTCAFSDVPDGSYAISVYQDENDNGRLDTNFIGMPKEGVGASNDAKARFGPPKYADARFAVEGKDLALTIPMHYL